MSINPKYTKLILGIKGLGLRLGFSRLVLIINLILTLIPRITLVFIGHGNITTNQQLGIDKNTQRDYFSVVQTDMII